MYTYINIYNMIIMTFFNFVLYISKIASGVAIKTVLKENRKEKKKQVPPLNDQSHSAAV